MKTAKTAISLPQDLLETTDKIAQETGNSRSGVVAIALTEYFQRLENEQMLAQLNEVYGDESITSEDANFIDAGKAYIADRVIEREQW